MDCSCATCQTKLINRVCSGCDIFIVSYSEIPFNYKIGAKHLEYFTFNAMRLALRRLKGDNNK